MRTSFTSAALLLAAAASAGAAQVGGTTMVFGHKIPDTDAICAAMVYAWELNLRGIPAQAYRLGELNRETEYVMKALGVEMPPLLEGSVEKAPVAIVDTNNPEELPEGIHKAKVHSIIDHHKMSGLTTSAPLELDVRPLCSTGSILYSRAKAAGRTPPPEIAGLMLSCILSDSLEFRSPTTTPQDVELAQELAMLAGIDLHKHAEAMLDAKAEIGHLSAQAIVMLDSKVFEIGGRKLRISVVETTRPERALERHSELVEAQRKVVQEQRLDDVLFFVVDVLNEQATFLSSSPSATAIVERAWSVACSSAGTVVLPGVLSRKKQIIPVLEEAASSSTADADRAQVDARARVSAA